MNQKEIKFLEEYNRCYKKSINLNLCDSEREHYKSVCQALKYSAHVFMEPEVYSEFRQQLPTDKPIY